MAVVNLSSIWLGPICRDLESKQSLKSYDFSNRGWHRFLLLTVPTFPSGCLQNESWRLLSALITIRCTFSSTPFCPVGFSHSKKSLKCVSFEMWHINPCCWWELLSTCGALPPGSGKPEEVHWAPSGSEVCLSPLNLQGRKHQENHFLVRVLALPVSSLTRTTSRTVCRMSVFRLRLLRKKDKRV